MPVALFSQTASTDNPLAGFRDPQGVSLFGHALDVSGVTDATQPIQDFVATGSKGGVRSETVRAFTEAEYRKVIAALP